MSRKIYGFKLSLPAKITFFRLPFLKMHSSRLAKQDVFCTNNLTVSPCRAYQDIRPNLINRLGLIRGAAGFKKFKGTVPWCFPEVNSKPLFTLFDTSAYGAVSKAIFSNIESLLPE
jgi:hypothetical protein